jgi:hypothetical protein
MNVTAVISWHDSQERKEVESFFRLQPSPYYGWDVVQTWLLDQLLFLSIWISQLSCCNRKRCQLLKSRLRRRASHNVLNDHLWGRGYNQVYVIPRTVAKSSRGWSGATSCQAAPGALIILIKSSTKG